MGRYPQRARTRRRPAGGRKRWWRPARTSKGWRRQTEGSPPAPGKETMALSVAMPALGMAQATGKLLAWRKNMGEGVTKGEPLLEIETDKAVVEVEAPGDGILAGVTADVGAVVPVGQTIAWLVLPAKNLRPWP